MKIQLSSVMVNAILTSAIKRHASDIHLEPFEVVVMDAKPSGK